MTWRTGFSRRALSLTCLSENVKQQEIRLLLKKISEFSVIHKERKNYYLLFDNYLSIYNVYDLCPKDGTIILKTPAFPVTEGDSVALHCQYWTGNHGQTTFFKNGTEIFTVSSSSSVVTMTVDNVTRGDEGFYKCASRDRKIESPESWLSVRPGRGQPCHPKSVDGYIHHSHLVISVKDAQ